MDALLAPLLSWLLLYKYAALAIVVYVSAVIVPLPTNAMLLAVGAFSSQGYFNFWISLLIAVLGNVLGDITDYGLTRRYGEPVIRFLRFRSFPLFGHIAEELRTDASITVFLTRFGGVLSPVTSLLAGLVGVDFRTFIVPDILGNIIEPFGALALGAITGNYWNSLSGILGLCAGIVAVATLIFVVWRIHRRIMKKYGARG